MDVERYHGIHRWFVFAVDGTSQVDFGRGIATFVRDGAFVATSLKAFGQTDIDGHWLVFKFTVSKGDFKCHVILFVVQ